MKKLVLKWSSKLSTFVVDLKGLTKNNSTKEADVDGKFQQFQNDFDTEAQMEITASKSNLDVAKENHKNALDGKGENLVNTQKQFSLQNEVAKTTRDSKIAAITETNLTIEKNINTQETTLKALSSQYYRTDAIHKPIWIVWAILAVWVYWIFLLVVAFSEAPLNRIVFELLGESYLFTSILALALGMVIAMFAHFTGLLVYKARTSDRGKKAFHWILVALICVIMFALAMAIGNMRATFFEKSQNVAQVNPYVMGLINFVFYIVASFLAYFHASETKLTREQRTAYRDLYKVVKNLKKSVAANKGEIDTANKEYITTLNNNATQQVVAIQTAMANDQNVHKAQNIEESKNALEAAISKYDEDLVEYKAFCAQITDAHQKAILELRKAQGIKEKKNIITLSKLLVFVIPILMLFVMASCGNSSYNNGKNTKVAVLLDVSEKDYSLGKYLTAEKLVEIMNVVPNERRGRQNNYGSISFSTINSLNNNYVSMVELKKPKDEWESNSLARQEECEKFIKNVEQELKNLSGSQESKETAIYLPLCQMAQKMSDADNKVIIIISDMMENDGKVSFYGSALDQLKAKPEQFQKKLENMQQLPSLSGFTIYFLYTSTDEKRDKEFTIASRFWKNLLESKGATINIASNL
jgi:hypothetical protein